MNIIIIFIIIIIIIIVITCSSDPKNLEHLGNSIDYHVGDTSTVNKQNNTKLITYLNYWHNILSAYSVKHWLLYDTLLQAVRDTNLDTNSGVFSFGMTIDGVDIINTITIPDSDYSISKNYVLAYDYITSISRSNLWDMTYNINYKGSLVGKLYVFTTFDDGFVRIYDESNDGYFYPRSTFPAWFIQTLSCERLNNKCYPAPRVASSLLDSWYGENWDKPTVSGSIAKSNIDINDVIDISNLIGYVRHKGIQIQPRLNKRIKFVYPLTGKRWIDSNDPPVYFDYT